jgi:hypothetical protein
MQHEAAVALGEADDARRTACGLEPAQQALQQPRPEGVEPFDAHHVDVDVAELSPDRTLTRDHPFDQLLKLARALGRPKSAGAQRQPARMVGTVEQGRAGHGIRSRFAATERSGRAAALADGRLRSP